MDETSRPLRLLAIASNLLGVGGAAVNILVALDSGGGPLVVGAWSCLLVASLGAATWFTRGAEAGNPRPGWSLLSRLLAAAKTPAFLTTLIGGGVVALAIWRWRKTEGSITPGSAWSLCLGVFLVLFGVWSRFADETFERNSNVGAILMLSLLTYGLLLVIAGAHLLGYSPPN